MPMKVIGLEELEKDMKSIVSQLPSKVTKFLNSLTFELMNYVKKDTPIDTSLLKRSWFFQRCKVSGNLYETTLANNVDYAAHVEYGHRIIRAGETVGFVKGRRMLQNNVDIMREQMPRRLTDFLDDLLKARVKK